MKSEEYYSCLQCAVCTGSCPTARAVEGFNPRELVLRYLLDGKADEVLDSDLIWACTTCQICQERCPHDIDIFGLLLDIMNRAAARGNLPKMLKDGIKLIKESGWALPVNTRLDQIRRQLGLDPIQKPHVSEINQLLQDAGLDEILS